MKAFSTVLCLALTAALTCDAWAKRSGPKQVAPVIHDGVKYVAPNLNRREGKVEALDPKTGEKLWDKLIYTVKIDPNLEQDVQWVFITALSIRDGKLLVTNEKGDQYTLDLKTKEVENVKKDGPVRGAPSPTPSFSSESASAQWGPDVKLSTNEVSAALNENMGRCIVTSSDMVYVVWTDLKNNGQAIYFKRSTGNGATWEPDRRISGSPSTDQWPLLAVSGDTLHLVFLRDFGTDKSASYYKRSTDGGNTWGLDVLLGKTKWWPGIAAAGPMVSVPWRVGRTTSTN
jgi:hypothetical protein